MIREVALNEYVNYECKEEDTVSKLPDEEIESLRTGRAVQIIRWIMTHTDPQVSVYCYVRIPSMGGPSGSGDPIPNLIPEGTPLLVLREPADMDREWREKRLSVLQEVPGRIETLYLYQQSIRDEGEEETVQACFTEMHILLLADRAPILMSADIDLTSIMENERRDPDFEIEEYLRASLGKIRFVGQEALTADEFRLLLDPEDQPLFDGLRAFRRELALDLQVSAYIIFSNLALFEMARKAPGTEEELLNVKGIGKKIADRYGKKILDYISLFKEESEAAGEGAD